MYCTSFEEASSFLPSFPLATRCHDMPLRRKFSLVAQRHGQLGETVTARAVVPLVPWFIVFPSWHFF